MTTLPSLLLWACVADRPDPAGGSPDGGSPDGGSTDGGSTDGGSTDGGSPDGGSADGGSPDGGGTTDDCAPFAEQVVSTAVDDHGDPSQPGSLAALAAALPDACDSTLRLDQAAAYPLATSLTLPARVDLAFVDGAVLDLSDAAELWIPGGIEAGRSRIFGDGGAVLGPPAVEEVWPEWFGAAPDDALDDTLPIQRSARLHGPAAPADAAILRGALVYPSSGGFHPTRLVAAVDVSDVELRDLTLDGDRHSRETDCWSYPETDNLARFEGVSGLVLQSVHLVGYEANWGAEDWTLAQALAVVGSQDIAFLDVELTDSRTEGILILDSQRIVVERLYTRNTDVWTPLSALYVEDITLSDSEIIEDEGVEWTGSTLNVTARGASVQGSRFVGGWGLDFGDETGEEAFGVRDILIEDNDIETVGMSVYFSPYAEGDRATGVQIRDNRVLLHRGAAAEQSDMMIRIDACEDVRIEDNQLEVVGEGDAFVFGLSLQGSSADVHIQGNTLSGVDAGVTHSGDSPDGGDLSIVDNAITCADTVRRDTWSGGATAVWIFRYVAAGFGTIRVEGNDVDCAGGWVSLIDYGTLSGAPPPFIDHLEVRDNTFLPEAGPQRPTDTDRVETWSFTGNTPAWFDG
ncbi:hypothetical protein L6R53_03850 [Myxococcota bacterium]|nr:hypothetical protein [Myxococcota bacterium]